MPEELAVLYDTKEKIMCEAKITEMTVMKNNLFIGFLFFFVLLSVGGCSLHAEVTVPSEDGMSEVGLPEHSEGEDRKEHDYYRELIAAAEECIQTRDVKILEKYGFSSAIMTPGEYGIRGYLIEDIDGNGIDELIFGESRTERNSSWDSMIYDVYTISDGEPVHVLNGWERNRYYFCENGMIANEGSSGAANSNYSYFTFEGSKLHLVESVIYDGTKDAEHPWFYSTESEYDAEEAEPISEEKAVEIRQKYIYENPAFTPFVKEH